MKRLGLTLAICLIATPVLAQTPKPKPLIPFPNLLQGSEERNNAAATANAGQNGGKLDQFIEKINQIGLDDLKYALALSKQANNVITTPCWQALVDVVGKQNAEVKDDQGNVLKKPDPHLFVNVEIASQWLSQLQPNSTISLGCAPMAAAAKKDLLNVITGIVGGVGAAGMFPIPF